MSEILNSKLMADLFGETSQTESNQVRNVTERLDKPVYEILEAQKTDKTLQTVEKKGAFSSYRPENLAAEILKNAIYEAPSLDAIKERACIRWENGLSDSLFDAVLCNIAPMNEQPERDKDERIILQPRTDWNKELAKYRV